ncbi:hypothetical protein [Candidatus Viridilinea mediisalina]|uniref:Uncharacterized protein n=1 Tax=Candidatus Viridilinea mediisalina TaxID=2024553 RepID=A0A2A6RHX8_9CHLR|nr:hypothetical protein [Candidatus Viridilinea mediisalina]PDW02485.1 hypothetical protein CJ255_13645 [Candidatus Viridilinea mediisalina]
MCARRVESFLLRIVVPGDEALTPERWRGRIQHIASGSEQQIDELAQAVAFISAHLGPPSEFVLELDQQPPAQSP